MSDSSGFELFSHESTVSQSAGHIVRLMVLQQFDLLLRSYRVFLVSRENSSDMVSNKRVFLAHARSLIVSLRPTWIRKNKDSFQTVNELLEKEDIHGLVDSFSVFLDQIELTRFDLKKSYDRTSFVQSNKTHGYY